MSPGWKGACRVKNTQRSGSETDTKVHCFVTTGINTIPFTLAQYFLVAVNISSDTFIARM